MKINHDDHTRARLSNRMDRLHYIFQFSKNLFSTNYVVISKKIFCTKLFFKNNFRKKNDFLKSENMGRVLLAKKD
jgi:hypothetical protein